MKRKLLQSVADFILRKINKAESEDAIQFYYEFGIWIDRLAIDYFDISLE